MYSNFSKNHRSCLNTLPRGISSNISLITQSRQFRLKCFYTFQAPSQFFLTPFSTLHELWKNSLNQIILLGNKTIYWICGVGRDVKTRRRMRTSPPLPPKKTTGILLRHNLLTKIFFLKTYIVDTTQMTFKFFFMNFIRRKI